MDKRLCPKCGNTNPSNWIACANCGASLTPQAASKTSFEPAANFPPSSQPQPMYQNSGTNNGGCIRGYEQGFGFGCGCLVFIIAIFWFLAYIGTSETDSPGADIYEETSAPAPNNAYTRADIGGCVDYDPQGVVVTHAEYSRLQTGMTYGQVAFTLCALGTENHRSELGGIVTEGYTWQNEDGSNLIVMFQNGELVNKTATMLP